MKVLIPRLALTGICLLSLLLAGCSRAPEASGELTKVTLQTDWYPQPEHGGYYQALAKGFYREEGLDVTIRPGGPNAQVMAMTATGRADFGMTNGDDVITAISHGLPLKMVAAEMQRDPQGVLFHAEHPLRDLRDLDGKTLMAGAGSIWLQLVPKEYGIHFNILPLAGDLARFMNDPHFIQQCFVTNEPYFARQRGAKVGAILVAHPGYEPYRVVLTSDAYLKAHPDIVARFVRATIRGWRDYLTGDPAPANAMILKLRSDLTPEFCAYSIQAMKDYALVLGDATRGEKAGQLTVGRLQTQIDLLGRLGVLEKPLQVSDVARLEFLPPEAR